MIKAKKKGKRKKKKRAIVTSPIGPVGWGIHTALSKLHQIFGLRKACGQA